MKIRWTEYSVRLRITPPELEALREEKPLLACLRLPGRSAPVWTIRVLPEAGESRLCSFGNEVRLYLGECDRERLAAPENEGVYFQEEQFRYYIEKDFPCLHPRPAEALEPESKTFARVTPAPGECPALATAPQ